MQRAFSITWRSAGWRSAGLCAGLCAALVSMGCDGEPAEVDGGEPTMDAGADAGSPEDAGTDREDGGSPEDAGAADGGPVSALDTFEDDVATAQCAALFRCCDDASVEEFFSQYQAFPGLSSPFEEFQDRLPPTGTVDETNCVDLMRDLNEAAPFGAWLTEARAGHVTFDEAAHAACLTDLETAACGVELQDALYDPMCFSHAGRPYVPTDPHQDIRAMFIRTRGLGESCVELEDSSKDPYGTCDPEVAFCCFRPEGDPSAPCGGPADGPGTCEAVGRVDDECSAGPERSYCAPGLYCKPGASFEDPSLCATPNTTPLANGETCIDGSFQSTGECTDGFCSQTTMECEAHLAEGEACNQSSECASGNCAGMPPEPRTCQPFAFCVSGGTE